LAGGLFFFFASSANAVEWSVQLDGAALVPLSQPQASYFGGGAQVGLRGALELAPAFDLQAGATAEFLPARRGAPVAALTGGAGLSVGARLKRPLGDNLLLPWLSVSLGWTLSGVHAVSLMPAAGLNMRVSPTSPVLFGPFVRLAQFFKTREVPGYQTVNATMLAIGLMVEFAPRENKVEEDAAPPPLPAPAARDSDGDGVPDDVDRCPNNAEDKDGYQDDDGCPDPDNDGDGVLDVDDKCPMVKGPAATHGCPDGDGDGIPDMEDACPNKAGKREDSGCPVYKELVVTASHIEIKQKIFFAFGTARIMPRSHPLLGEVVEALQDRPNLCVRIEGHTDAVGGADANRTLSQNRTVAVRDFLVSQGVTADRLSAMGYGSSLPLDTNATTEGREKNRRVEFVIVPCQPKEAP
jgi:outer membrane protein OmpA-like peptidoglycan-associated protein